MMKMKKADITDKSLSPDLLRKMDAYWRAANYLSVGQIYLFDNPLLRKPLTLKHVKPRLMGHWGTTPGIIANTYLDGTSTTPFGMVVLNVGRQRLRLRWT